MTCIQVSGITDKELIRKEIKQMIDRIDNIGHLRTVFGTVYGLAEMPYSGDGQKGGCR